MKKRKSLKYQIIIALSVQFLVLLVVVSVSLYLLNLRKHDYIILNLAGQLRVISEVMLNQSDNYVEVAPRDYDAYNRDLKLYRKDLVSQIDSYEKIIQSFKARNLSPNLITQTQPGPASHQKLGKVPTLLSNDQALYCTWDIQSRSQLDSTAAVWAEFMTGLTSELGDMQEPRLEAAAKYIQLNGQELIQASADLAIAFRLMMEKKLLDIRIMNQVSLVISFLIAMTILFIFYRKIFRPVTETVRGFQRVAQGDLRHQVPIAEYNEIGHLTEMFNKLTHRLSTLFRLTDSITQATNLDQTLEFVFEEFSDVVPMDWILLIRTDHSANSYYIERLFNDKNQNINEGDSYNLKHSLCENVLQHGKAVSLHDIQNNNSEKPDGLLYRFTQEGLQSVIYLPLSISGKEQVILVFATHQANAYHREHLELLENIAGQVSHGFEKTIGMESLVVSAVEGLAKLAESRDPETGDHLFRMSHYSAIIAEQLGKDSPYKDQINPSYVRDILRFAPMHDIGKVGIEDSILLKPGKLTSEERTIMEQHPVIGSQVLQRCEQQVNAVGHSIFRIGIEIAEGHHEKFNGQGYPKGLAGNNIPLSARIVAAADVFDALTSKRPYKEAWPIDKAIEVIQQDAGAHFDPVVIQALQQSMPRIMEIYEQYKHL